MRIYILFTFILFFIQLKSQTCYINPDFIASSQTGLYPPSNVIGIPNGKVGLLYSTSLSYKSKTDTSFIVVGTVHLCVTRYELVSPSGITNFGLPNGLSLQGIPTAV